MSFGPASGYYNRPSRGLPCQVAPVTGCDFLAYSCAAARDLHPLPIGQRVAGLRSCANLILRKSEKKQQPGKSTGHCETKSNGTSVITVERRAPRPSSRAAGGGRPALSTDYPLITVNSAEPTRATFSSAKLVTLSNAACNCL